MGWWWPLSLSVLCCGSQCADLSMEEGRVGWREVGGSGQLYLVGEASCAWASWRRVGGTESTIQLAVSTKHPFATKHTHTRAHTPSGTDSALNFLPVILAAGQRETEREGEREGNFKTAVERMRERGAG